MVQPCWSAQPCAPTAVGHLPAPGSYLEVMLAEVDAELGARNGASPTRGGSPLDCSAPGGAPPDRRVIVDCRGHSPLAVLADAVSAGEPVLALCADVARRLGGLRERLGGKEDR